MVVFVNAGMKEELVFTMGGGEVVPGTISERWDDTGAAGACDDAGPACSRAITIIFTKV